MTEEDSAEVNERQSSIEVSQNAKGDHAYKVKQYYDSKITEGIQVVEEIKKIYDKLHSTF